MGELVLMIMCLQEYPQDIKQDLNKFSNLGDQNQFIALNKYTQARSPGSKAFELN